MLSTVDLVDKWITAPQFALELTTNSSSYTENREMTASRRVSMALSWNHLASSFSKQSLSVPERMYATMLLFRLLSARGFLISKRVSWKDSEDLVEGRDWHDDGLVLNFIYIEVVSVWKYFECFLWRMRILVLKADCFYKTFKALVYYSWLRKSVWWDIRWLSFV
jgi:hypothetical protein